MYLRVGFAETDITPPIGVWMGGYAFRPTGCTGVHDPLFARACYFENQGKSILIVSMDLIGLDFDIVDAVKSGIHKSIGVPPAGIMLNATHTHGGPLTKSYLGMGMRDAAYIGWLIHRLIQVAGNAAESMSSREIFHSRVPARIGVNRRMYNGEQTVIGVNPDGPIYPWVDIIIVSNWGRAIAAIFSYACHPTTLGRENLEITADFCGYACDYIKEESDGSIFPMFLQGCSGNINPRQHGNFGWARTNGRALGKAVLDSVKAYDIRGRRANLFKLERDLSVDYSEELIDLDLEAPTSLEDSEREAIRWDIEAYNAKQSGNEGTRIHAEGMRDYYIAESEAVALGEDEWFSHAFLIQRIKVGDVQILGMPAEMFVQYAIDFSRQAEGPLITLGCTNGIHGYIPTNADCELGGYEVAEAHKYYGQLPYWHEYKGHMCEGRVRSAVYYMLGIQNPDNTPYTV